MKRLKILIIAIIISVIFIVIFLYLFNIQKNNNEKNDNKAENNYENKLDYEIVNRVADTNQVAPVLSKDEYFKNISYNTYFTISNCISSDIKNNIIINIKSIIVDKVNSYVVNAIEMNDNYEYVKNKYYIVNLDYGNSTFLIEDVTDRYNRLEDIKVNKIDSIKLKNNNYYVQNNYSEEYKYRQIFEHIKCLMLVKPELAYEYLDEEYKQNRFGSYDNFRNYVNNNRKHLIEIIPKSYKTNDDKTIIQIKDQYSNWYRFKITNTMEYKATIDNYVVLNEDDIKHYSKLSDKEKVEYNLNRIQKMFNSKDYKFIYDCLDDTFKEENYSSLSDFTKFINEELNGNYEIGSKKITKDGNVYVIELEVSNKEKAYSEKYFNVIMRLDKGTDFTMSFSKE